MFVRTATLEELELRVRDREIQVAELRRQLQRPNIEAAFGMFGGDPTFDEVIGRGREYRARKNSQSN